MRAALLAVLAFLCVHPAPALTIHVPDDEPTIQAGINAAAAGDTVLVATGTYYECAVQMKSGVFLRGETGTADGVIIDAQRHDTVLICNEVQADARIEGLTLTGGLAPGTPQESRGGGLYCTDSSPAIQACAFIDNEAVRGGGLYCRASNPTLSECAFVSNRAYTGGGAYLGLSRPSFFACRFVGNEVETDGGALVFGYASPEINGCVFTQNIARWWGGVIFASGESTPHIHNCTMVQNSTTLSWGGAIFTCGQCRPVLENDLIAFNSGDGAINADNQESLPELRCCNVFGNDGGDYGGALPDQTGLNGNISEDPLFCDLPAGDLTLATASPCLPENNDCQVLIGALGQGCGAPAAVETGLLPPPFGSWCVPNPTPSAAVIHFRLYAASEVSLEIFDLQGRCVRGLRKEAPAAAGSHRLSWDGRTDQGRRAAPGVYLYHLVAGARRSSGKVTLAE